MRKTFIDNLRSFVIVLVLIFHATATYNSNGSILNYNGKGLAYMDAIGYMTYPWFMILLFVVSGIVARYALEKRTVKSFMRERGGSLLVPFISYQALLGAPVSMFSFKINHIEESLQELPTFAIYIVRILNGMGPSWFLLQLFISSLIFALIYSIIGKNNNEKISVLSEKTNIFVLIALFIPVYISSQFLYIAFTFRFLLYTLAFILGFYVFSSDKVQNLLARYSGYLLTVGLILGAYFIDQWINTAIIKYLVLFVWTVAVSIILHNIVIHLPIVPQLLGMKKWRK